MIMIHLKVSNYTGAYTPLNNLTTLNVSRLDLARAMITVGRRSWSNTFHTGIFRIGELLCKALGFTAMNGNCVILNDRFFQLNQSEKGAVSYYFGQAFTKIYAEEHLGVKWLLHFDEYSSMATLQASGTATPKITIHSGVNKGSRPDLLGLVKTNTAHILEAKGYSKYYNKSVMQTAINQVSHVNLYNGIPPETRTACFFTLGEKKTKGIIIDPEDKPNAFNVEFDEVKALNTFYSFFRENKDAFNSPFEIRGTTYLTVPVGVPDIFVGFNASLLEMTTEKILESGFEPSRNSNYSDNVPNGYSIGSDGIIILDRKFLPR